MTVVIGVVQAYWWRCLPNQQRTNVLIQPQWQTQYADKRRLIGFIPYFNDISCRRTMSSSLTNKPVPGAREFYPLNEPEIGTLWDSASQLLGSPRTMAEQI